MGAMDSPWLKLVIQRIARRDKKAFLSEQCKEIEENKRMEKTRDLEIPKEHGMDLTEAEDLKKRWQDYTEELCKKKKKINDLDNHDGAITHLEPDILKCKVKWALGSINTNKASGDDGISTELFIS